MTSASDELQNLLSSEPIFFKCFLATQASLFVDSIALICSLVPMLLKTLNFCLWSCTLEQILAYLIDNFCNTLLSSKLKG